MQVDVFPIAQLREIPFEHANALLEQWGHKMGAMNHDMREYKAHALYHHDSPVAIATTSVLMTPQLGSGRRGGKDFDLSGLTRANTCELSRLIAVHPHLCRVMLRLWRELVFPYLPYDYTISYQDAKEHQGYTYRFDGWRRIGYSASGTDQRSGRQGRRKWIWGWNCDHLPAI